MYLVDTSIWVHALRPHGNRNIQERLRPFILSGQAALASWIVLELMTGIRSDEEQRALNAFLSPLPRFQVDDSCWEISFRLAATLRKKGVSPSAADCLIAATAVAHKASLIHLDHDFSRMARLAELQEMNWTHFL